MASAFPALEFADSDALQVGDLVLAIGNPFAVGQTVTHGIVSALARTQVGITDYQFFIQTDAAINPGNSGGALVDMSGKLVGINTAIFSRGGGSIGIGFAIPANMVRVVVASARGRRQHGQAAVARRAAAGGDAGDRREHRPQTSGRRAGRAGDARQPGRARGSAHRRPDRRARRSGRSRTSNAFDYRFATKTIGGTSRIRLQRSGREMTVTVALEAAPELPREEIVIEIALAVPGREGVEHVAGARRPVAARSRRRRASSWSMSPTARSAQRLASSPATSCSPSTIRRSTTTGDLDKLSRQQTRLWRITIRRGGQQMSVELRG